MEDRDMDGVLGLGSLRPTRRAARRWRSAWACRRANVRSCSWVSRATLRRLFTVRNYEIV